MLKKVLQGAVLGAAMLGVVGTASADTRNINIYGASAQYLFWNDAAGAFLSTKHCSAVERAATADGKNGITKGTGCADYAGDNIFIRYSSKASFDGIDAMMGRTTYTGDAEKCSEGDPGVTSTKANYFRKMADEGTCTFTTYPAAPGSCSGTKCVDVTLGAADVAGESFTQSSSGKLLGPLGGADTTRSFHGLSTTGLTPYRPIVVPFGFFVNNSVMRGDPLNPGHQVQLDNITREMAVMIFSGQAYYWTDFGQDWSSDPIVACFRHAGSGTHATLDYAVVKGNGWGAQLISAENASEPTAWFNDGSGDEMKCVNGSGSWAGTGAIGYADADQSLSSYTNTHALKYQGEPPRRITIRNGLYDFWSSQWIYEDPNEPTYGGQHGVHPVHVDLMNYASNPANIPTSKSAWWATRNEMVYMKASDQAYPQYVGAASPQNP